MNHQTDPRSPAGDDLIALGPDALAAEFAVLCAWASDEFDGTPDEIFYRSETDSRRYDRIRAAVDLFATEVTGRAKLVAMNAQENAGL